MGSLRIMLVYWDAVLFHLMCMIFGSRRRNVRRVKVRGAVVGHFAFWRPPPGRMFRNAWMWGWFAACVDVLDESCIRAFVILRIGFCVLRGCWWSPCGSHWTAGR